ncbi:hypothetical protein D3C72_2240880 [compost metagenome]
MARMPNAPATSGVSRTAPAFSVVNMPSANACEIPAMERTSAIMANRKTVSTAFFPVAQAQRNSSGRRCA